MYRNAKVIDRKKIIGCLDVAGNSVDIGAFICIARTGAGKGREGFGRTGEGRGMGLVDVVLKRWVWRV